MDRIRKNSNRPFVPNDTMRPRHGQGGPRNRKLHGLDNERPVFSMRSKPLPFGIKTLLVPLDCDSRSAALLLMAATFAEQLGADLVLLHVYEFKEYASACTTPQQFLEWKAGLHREAEAEFAKFIAGYEINPRIQSARHEVRAGYLENEIASAVKRMMIDLVVVTSHSYTGFKRLFLGSKAGRILKRAGCPVMVIPGLPE